MEVPVKLEEPEDELSVQSPLTTRSQPTFDETSESEMTSAQVSLVPSNLARPPVLWSAQEVKAWLEFCVKEFSLRPVCVSKFDMNGKALLLLTRTDFIERAPHAGDVLYNVFQRLLPQEGPAYLRSPVFVPTPAHLISPSADILARPLQSVRAPYISIRPQPPPSISGSSSSCTYPITNNVRASCINLAAGEENIPDSPSVPASMLSPAPSEKCPSDSDSSHNENGRSPHPSEPDMDCEESMNFDPGREMKYDIIDQHDDGVCRLLWEFIYQLLQDSKWSELVSWESVSDLTFRILNPTNLADAWGKQKNRSNMTYEKLSRALRYYYKMNIIKKVPGKRLTYKFLQHPATIRKGQRGARPHSCKTVSASTEDTPATIEATTPDSSTFLIAPTLSASSTSSTTTMRTHDTSCIVGSSMHQISNVASENNTTKSSFGSNVIEHNFLHSSQERRCNDQEQGSLFYQDTDHADTSETTVNMCRSLSVTAGHPSDVPEKRQSKYCGIRDNYESGDRSNDSRSGGETFSDSLQQNENYRSQTMKGVGHKSLPMTGGHVYNGSVHYTLPTFENKPSLFTYYDRKNHLHKSAQDLAQETDAFSRSSSPSSTSSLPETMRSFTPVMSNPMRSPGNSKNYTPYSHHHHLHHPYSRPLPFNRTPPPQLKAYGQLRSNNLPTDYFPASTEHQHRNQLVTTHHTSDFHMQQTNYSHHSLKQESREQEQDEPEDLSMKACLPKDDSRIIKPEPVLPHGSRIKDEHRDSPRSSSSDSAYSSDRADFGKEGSVG